MSTTTIATIDIANNITRHRKDTDMSGLTGT
jgi:hypothetical protein